MYTFTIIIVIIIWGVVYIIRAGIIIQAVGSTVEVPLVRVISVVVMFRRGWCCWTLILKFCVWFVVAVPLHFLLRICIRFWMTAPHVLRLGRRILCLAGVRERFRLMRFFGVAVWALPRRYRFQITWLCSVSGRTGGGTWGSHTISSTGPWPLPLSHGWRLTGHALLWVLPYVTEEKQGKDFRMASNSDELHDCSHVEFSTVMEENNKGQSWYNYKVLGEIHVWFIEMW